MVEGSAECSDKSVEECPHVAERARDDTAEDVLIAFVRPRVQDLLLW